MGEDERETPSTANPLTQPIPEADVQESAGEARAATTQRIELRFVAGDLTVTGGAPAVLVEVPGAPSASPVAPDGSTLHLMDLPNRTHLRIPDGVELVVREVSGDLRASRVRGLLQVQGVAGDVALDAVAVAQVEGIGGDLRARSTATLYLGTIGGDARIEGGDSVTLHGAVGGSLWVEQLRTVQARIIGGDVYGEHISATFNVGTIGGDARLRGVAGSIRCGVVGGDLEIEDAPGGVVSGQVGGDAVLETPLGAGAEYVVQARGDITLRARGELHARFVAQTTAGEIRTRLPLAVERGRRRNLVGVLGRGDATVTLRSSGGDIAITGALADTSSYGREREMSDQFGGRGPNEHDDEQRHDEHTWEGGVGKRRFRVRVDRGPGRAGVYFQGPFGPDEEPEATANPRDFGVKWERGQGAHTYGEYEARLNEFRDKAEQVARRAAEEAQTYAEKAAKRARETDWEAMGREVRSTIEKAMGELEGTFSQMRREWETRRPGDPTPRGGGNSRPGAQRVRIEHDDEPAADAASAQTGTPGTPTQDSYDAQRRYVLEQLRTGAISLDEAERRLSNLH